MLCSKKSSFDGNHFHNLEHGSKNIVSMLFLSISEKYEKHFLALAINEKP